MAFEQRTGVRRDTPWEDGTISVTIAAIEVHITPTIAPLMVYGVGVDIIHPSRLNLPDKSLDSGFGTLEDMQTFIAGLCTGVSLMNGPALCIPEIGLPVEG